MIRARAQAALDGLGRWRWPEFAFWAAAGASWFVLPEQHLLLNEVAILGLFALSLDLVLGFGGIISLGHAAFFGCGAYVVGILAKAGYGDPLLGLAAAAVAATVLGFVTSFLVLRGSDLTRLMVTLSVSLVLFEVANRTAWLTGGADGLQGMTVDPVLGRFAFDMFGSVAYGYSLVILFALFLVARRVMHSPFGLSVRAVKGNPLRTAAIGIPVNGRLVAIYTMAAAYAGVAGGLLAQTTQFVSLDVIAFHRSADVMLTLVLGGVGYLYGGLIGALLFKFAQSWLSDLTPEYWQFWLGLVFVALVVAGRDRVFGWPEALLRRIAR
jgi:branched-chain amino acid transport system permease protein